jgi:hypothetical protein
MLPEFRIKLTYSNVMPHKKLNPMSVFLKTTDSCSHVICYAFTESFFQLLSEVVVLLYNCHPSNFFSQLIAWTNERKRITEGVAITDIKDLTSDIESSTPFIRNN